MPLTIYLSKSYLAQSEATFELGVESEILYIALLPKGVSFASSTLHVPFMSGVKDLCKALLENRHLVTTEDDRNTISSIDTLSLPLNKLDFYRRRDILKATENQLIGFVVTHFSDELTLKTLGVTDLPIPAVFVFRTNKAEYEGTHLIHESTLSGSLVNRLETFWKKERGPNEIEFALTDKGVTLGQGDKQEVSRSLYPIWNLCHHLVKDCSQYMDLSPNRDSNPTTSCKLEELDRPFTLVLIEGIKSEYIIPVIKTREDTIGFTDAIMTTLQKVDEDLFNKCYYPGIPLEQMVQAFKREKPESYNLIKQTICEVIAQNQQKEKNNGK